MLPINSYVFLDLEATGLPSIGERPRITELSLVSVHRQTLTNRDRSPLKLPRVLDKLTLCVYPMKQISPKAVEITDLCNDNLMHTKDFDENIAKCMSFFLLRQEPPICLIAHNGLGYDFPLLQAELLSLSLSLPVDILCLDSLIMLRDLDATNNVALDRRFETFTNQETPIIGSSLSRYSYHQDDIMANLHRIQKVKRKLFPDSPEPKQQRRKLFMDSEKTTGDVTDDSEQTAGMKGKSDVVLSHENKAAYLKQGEVIDEKGYGGNSETKDVTVVISSPDCNVECSRSHKAMDIGGASANSSINEDSIVLLNPDSNESCLHKGKVQEELEDATGNLDNSGIVVLSPDNESPYSYKDSTKVVKDDPSSTGSDKNQNLIIVSDEEVIEISSQGFGNNINQSCIAESGTVNKEDFVVIEDDSPHYGSQLSVTSSQSSASTVICDTVVLQLGKSVEIKADSISADKQPIDCKEKQQQLQDASVDIQMELDKQRQQQLLNECLSDVKQNTTKSGYSSEDVSSSTSTSGETTPRKPQAAILRKLACVESLSEDSGSDLEMHGKMQLIKAGSGLIVDKKGMIKQKDPNGKSIDPDSNIEMFPDSSGSLALSQSVKSGSQSWMNDSSITDDILLAVDLTEAVKAYNNDESNTIAHKKAQCSSHVNMQESESVISSSVPTSNAQSLCSTEITSTNLEIKRKNLTQSLLAQVKERAAQQEIKRPNKQPQAFNQCSNPTTVASTSANQEGNGNNAPQQLAPTLSTSSSNYQTAPAHIHSTPHRNIPVSSAAVSATAQTASVPQSQQQRKPSYKLEEVYKRLFEKYPSSSHRAEDDCLTLLKICQAVGARMVSYADEHATLFSDIQPMYTVKKRTPLKPGVYPYH